MAEVILAELVKTTGHLLTDLFDAYYDARRHKRNSRSQVEFEMHLEENLIALYQEIVERRYKVSRSTCFIVHHPVKREIFAANFRDRVVHHLLYNYLSPMFERSFITDSYSCRRQKGTSYGIKRCEHHIRACSDNFRKPCYVLKLDVQGYFMHINRQRLFEIVMRHLQTYASRRSSLPGKRWKDVLDYETITYLLREVIFDDPTQECILRGNRHDWKDLPPNKSLFYSQPGYGLPIGNLTSQLFSNIYLGEFDNFVKHTLHEKHYGRYVDDFFIVHNDHEHLRRLLPVIDRFLSEKLQLTLHPHKVHLQSANRGLTFLGLILKPYQRYLRKRTVLHICQAVNATLQSNRLFYPGCFHGEVIESYLGYMQQANCLHLREKILERLYEEGRLYEGIRS
jgi:retron-type reverse transcriptase